MLALTYFSERIGQLTLTSLIGQIWAVPFLIYMNVVNTQEINKWVFFAILTLLLSYPNGVYYMKDIIRDILTKI